ncbi:hypothetical protein FHW31_003681 [Enterobacter asburiae]|nr:hypothetical protein [Enterobacter asburiae]
MIDTQKIYCESALSEQGRRHLKVWRPAREWLSEYRGWWCFLPPPPFLGTSTYKSRMIF